MSINIAIDGPAGAGKSTIARRLAEKLGYIYVDTGAMYRAMAYFFLSGKIDPKDEKSVVEMCKTADVKILHQNGEQQVLLNNENITGHIRNEEVGKIASVISVYPQVREKLVELQQKLAQEENVIMDGRDIGTCVLPNAQVKIYLTASVDTRAERRYRELLAKNITCDLAEIKKDIEDRDYRDMNREASPLKQADDAVLVDSSVIGIDEVVDQMYQICQEKMHD